MRNDIVLRTSRSARRVPVTVRQAVELQQYRGLEGSARVKAAAYVAHVGMTLTGQLSAEEGLLIQQRPLAEPRLKLSCPQVLATHRL